MQEEVSIRNKMVAADLMPKWAVEEQYYKDAGPVSNVNTGREEGY